MATMPVSGPSQISLDNLDGLFEGTIKRPWTSPLYVVGTFVVAVAMILLPAIYLGLIALVGYGLYYHATQDTWILTGATSGMKGRLLVYVAPLVCGVIMLFFMVKPLLARPSRRDYRVSLVKSNEPLLFAFVERICRIVGARTPSRIDLDCQVNASAGLRDGWRGFFTGELTLTIGAPLVAGLTIQEFAGVLAHEFGHFTQGVAMRMSYVIRSISFWFERVVYQRDEWDEKLEEAAKSNEGWISILFNLARLFVWLSRRILWVLMMIGHIVSCALLRQMEYDADRYNMRLVGSEAFERTSGKISLLAVSCNAAFNQLGEGWESRKLADNLPELTLAMLARMPREVRKEIEQADATRKTGLLDTHPSDAARIGRARREQLEGILHASGPAEGLFRDFATTARELTFSFYRRVMGEQVDRTWLVSTTQFKQHGDHLEAVSEAAKRYYHGGLITARPLKIDRHSKLFSASPEQCETQLQRARAALEKAGATVERVSDKYFETVRKEMGARCIGLLIPAGIEVDLENSGLKERTPKEVQRVIEEARREREAIIPSLAKIEAVLVMRLEGALGLLESGAMAGKLDDVGKSKRLVGGLLDALGCIHATRPTLQAMHPEQVALGAFANMIMGENSSPEVRREADRVLAAIKDRLAEVHEKMEAVANPIGSGEDKITLAEYVFGDSPRIQGDVLDVAALSESVIESSAKLYLHIMGELALVAEEIEQAQGTPASPKNT